MKEKKGRQKIAKFPLEQEKAAGEHFWCVGLANNCKLLYIELVNLGTLSQSIVKPMDIFAWALHKQVSMLLLVHNHPSGKLMPTKADLELTDQMIQVGRIVHIPVKDHLIITTEGYYSFESKVDLKRLQRIRNMYRVTFRWRRSRKRLKRSE